jgi:hypothetical protein
MEILLLLTFCYHKENLTYFFISVIIKKTLFIFLIYFFISVEICFFLKESVILSLQADKI